MRVQQVEGVGEHVARAAGGVDDLELFRAADLEKVGLLVDRGDVVVHLIDEARSRAVEYPKPAEGVFDEVADDPVRGEELGGCGDFSRRSSCSS